MAEGMFDIAIVGGGVNGCGIGRDATGRGLKTLIVEQGDLAGATSSASTKLVHGGLRYLEYYEFRLVREALMEREVLMRAAPHIIWPMRFVLPHHAGLRPQWLMRTGLFMYDHLGGRKLLPPTRKIDLHSSVLGEPLKPEYTPAFEYSDCWVEDSRLVFLNARDAADRGADVRTRTSCVAAERDGREWKIRLRDTVTGAIDEVRARALVNGAGPWAGTFMTGVLRQNTPAKVRMVKGSHIVTRKLYEHDRAYIFQNADGRICFAVPYEQDFTLIGTTDQDFTGDPAGIAISDEETEYLLGAVNDYFRVPVTKADVVWSYSGVRPLYDDGASKAQAATRDYVLTLDAPEGGAPLLNVFGGKITTYRRLAEAALAKLSPVLSGIGAAWTAGVSLPGGNMPVDGAGALATELRDRYPFLSEKHATRLVRTHGTLTALVLGEAREAADLGRDFGAGLTEREAIWMRDHEWARAGADILWRRTKLGLHMTPAERDAFTAWMDGQEGARAAA